MRGIGTKLVAWPEGNRKGKTIIAFIMLIKTETLGQGSGGKGCHKHTGHTNKMFLMCVFGKPPSACVYLCVVCHFADPLKRTHSVCSSWSCCLLFLFANKFNNVNNATKNNSHKHKELQNGATATAGTTKNLIIECNPTQTHIHAHAGR